MHPAWREVIAEIDPIAVGELASRVAIGLRAHSGSRV
jgi:hypothetical protein